MSNPWEKDWSKPAADSASAPWEKNWSAEPAKKPEDDGKGALDYAGAAVHAIGSGLIKGTADLAAGAGNAAIDPTSFALSTVMGGVAAADRGITAAGNWVAPGSSTVNQGIQDEAQSTAAFAAEQRAKAEQDAANGRGNGAVNAIVKGGIGVRDAGRTVSGAMQEYDQNHNPILMDQNKSIQDATGFLDTSKAMAMNPVGTINQLANSAPGMAAGLALSRGASVARMAGVSEAAGIAGDKAAIKALAAGADEVTAATASKAAQTAVIDAAKTKAIASASTAGAVSEAGQAAIQDRESVYQQVSNTPTDQLKASQRYRQILANVGNPNKAREILANELADQVTLGAGVVTGLGTIGVNKMFGGKDRTAQMVSGLERTTAKDVAIDIAQEGVEETLQGVPEDVVQHGALVQADPNHQLDLGGSAAQNFWSGALMSAHGGGAALIKQKMDDRKNGVPATPPAADPLDATPAAAGPTSVAPVDATAATPAAAAAPEVSAAEKALHTPVELTSLDRVNDIDKQESALRERQAELSDPTKGYGPMFDQERADLASQRLELMIERNDLAKDWPKAVQGAPASFTTEDGARVNATYSLMDAGDLVTSHDTGLRQNPAYPQELQPRDRDRAASEMQVSGIVQKLDPARLGLSADAANGAPIVGADGLVESGNARTIALMRVYQANGQKAADYKQWLKDNAAQFGLTPEAVDGMAKPVLVRVRTTPVNRAEFARQANASTVAMMSPSEQAKSDSARIDSMEDLAPDDNGDFSNAASRPFIRRFMARLPATEQAGMIDANGALSTSGYARVRNAVLAKAYGDSPVLARMVESMDDNLRNVSKALMLAAPKVAQMREAVGAGTRFAADITPDLMGAVEELSRLKEKGTSVDDALAQAGLLGDDMPQEVRDLLRFLADNARRPRKIADFINAYMEALDAAGDPNQGSLLGETTAPTKADLLTAAQRSQDATGSTNATPAENTQRPDPAKDAQAGAKTEKGPAPAPDNQGSTGSNGTAAELGTGQRSEQHPSGVAEQSEWVHFPKDSGTIGIPRADMPQVKSEHRGALIQFLQGRGIEHKTEDIPSADLKPTQAEFSTKKAARWSEVRDGVDRSVLVSKDGYILDGHHQWVAALSANEPVKAIVLDAPIRELMANVFQFPSVKQSNGATTEADSQPKPREDFKQAMAELADIVADALGTRVMMMPSGNPKLHAVLVKLFDSAIRVVGNDLKAATKWVKDQLKANPETKIFWNKITDKDYQSAALEALEKGAKKHVDDLFSVAEKSQSELFESLKESPKVAMIDGRPYEPGRDNFKAPDTATFLPADLLKRSRDYIKKFSGKQNSVVLTAEERSQAYELLRPMLADAQASKADYDQKIIDIVQRVGALGQLIPGKLKAIDRASEKLVEYRMSTSKMRDLLRSTIVVASYSDAQAVLDEIAKEFEIVAGRVKNRTDTKISSKDLDPDTGFMASGYGDLLVNVMINGVQAEIQINVPEMLSAKLAEGHDLYEIERSQPSGSDIHAQVVKAQSELYSAASFAALARQDDSGKTIGSESGGQTRDGESSEPTISNAPSPGITTDSEPDSRSKNLQPDGKDSGTFINTSNENTVTEKTDKGYTSVAKNQDVGEQLYANRRNFTGRGIKWDDVKDLNETLKVKEVTKAKIWPRPDYEKLVSEGMPVVLARLIKQVYDGISSGPVAKTPSNEVLQGYIDALTKVREGLFDFAKDKQAVAEFAQSILGTLDRTTHGGRVNVSELVKPSMDGRAVAEALIRRVWPEEFKLGMALRPFARGTRALGEIQLIGGNKALQAMQFTRSEFERWSKDITAGWPSKREAWEVQGYKVLGPDDYSTADKFAVTKFNRETGQSEPTGQTSYRVKANVGRGTWSRMETPFEGKKFLLAVDGGSFAREFDTREQAVEAAREKVKRKPGSGQDVRGMNIDDSERAGMARREEGDDVTSAKLMESFGFRGVNFGREGWINQVERQLYLNQAYDGLMDLAEIMGIPPKAVSLNGELGIAFGAQGNGKFAAHFVPGVNEINLTKTKGAGTLAHEWGHALDHYMAKRAGLGTDEEPFLSEHAAAEAQYTRIGNDGKPVTRNRFGDGIRPELVQAFNEIRSAMDKRIETAGEAKQRMEERLARSRKNLNGWVNSVRRTVESGRAENKADLLSEFDQLAERMRAGDLGEGYEKSGNKAYTQVVARMRTLVKEATGRLLSTEDTDGIEGNASHIKHLVDKMAADAVHEPQKVTTVFKSESIGKDRDKGGKAYWATPTEMFARAFELYVHDRLAEKGMLNTFLTNADQRASVTAEAQDNASAAGRAAGATKDVYLMPYPRGGERQAVYQAFGKLIDTIHTKEVEGGNVELLSRGAGGGMEFKTLQALASKIKKAMPNMPTVHVLASPTDIPPEAKELRDYIEKQGATHDVEGAFHNGELYLFASGLPDALRAEHVLAEHEAAHFGLRALLGDKLSQTMLMVYNNNTYIRQVAGELQKRGKLSNAQATEEAIVDIPTARLAQLKGWRTVVSNVRDWLQAHGFEAMAAKVDGWIKGTLTDQQRADMFVAELVRAARDFVAGKAPAATRPTFGTALSSTLAEDAAKQEAWLTREAKSRGYADIDTLAEKNYPLFEKLAKLWREKNPAENGVLLSRKFMPLVSARSDLEHAIKQATQDLRDSLAAKGEKLVSLGRTPHVLAMVEGTTPPTKMLIDASIQFKAFKKQEADGGHAGAMNAVDPADLISGIYRPAMVFDTGNGEFVFVTNILTEKGPVVVPIKINAKGSSGETVAKVMSAYPRERGRLADWVNGKVAGYKLVYADKILSQEAITGKVHPENKNPASGGVSAGSKVSFNAPGSNTATAPKTLPNTVNVPKYGSPVNKNYVGWSAVAATLQSKWDGAKVKGQPQPRLKDYGSLLAWIGKQYKGDPADMPMFSRAPAPTGTAAQRAEQIIQDNASTAKPIDALAHAITKVTGLGRATSAIYDKVGSLLEQIIPETVKAGMVSDYGVPEAVIDQRAMMQGRQRVQLRNAGKLVDKLSTLTRAESRVAYAWMNETEPGQADYFMQQLPPESVKILEDVRQMIDKLSREAVRMGQLSADVYEKTKFAYLRRSYAKYTMDQTAGQKAARARAISVLGDQYKNRGLNEAATMTQIQNAAPEWWKRKLAKGKADTSLKGEKFIRLERRAASGQNVNPLPGVVGNKALGKILEVHYFPAGEPLPAKYADWEKRETFEARDTKDDKVVMWRDFTKDEREHMGEIDEARFAIAKTLQGMIHDVEVGRYLEWLAVNQALKEGQTIPGTVVDASERYRDTFKPGEWVKVPDTKIGGTSVAKYGKLAGRYLPGPVWNDLRQTINGQFKPFGDTYQHILSLWKTSKTALSPAVHMNNVMSNFVMADWHDVTAGHTAKALRILLGAHDQSGKGVLGTVGNKIAGKVGVVDRDSALEIVTRYRDSGGDIGSWATNEISQKMIDPLLDAMEKELAETDGNSIQAQVGIYSAFQLMMQQRFSDALEAAKGSKAAKAVATETGTILELYQSEDEVFRLAAWLKAKEEGKTDMEAGKIARRSFMDYSINAPWIQAMRNSALPFVSYSYRAVPMFLETAAKKPHKLLKLMAIAGAINAFGIMFAGGGDDKERKLLPEEKAGRVWGLVPKLLRMPWNDGSSSPVYLDIRRFIPVGDVFDLGAGHTAIPILPMIQIGGPLAIIGELYANKSNFTGKPITLDTDTGFQQATKVLDYLFKAFAPNVLGLPGTYATTGVVNAATGKTDAFGREQSVAQAMASSFGVKLGSYPADVLRRNLRGAAQVQMMEIDKNISGLKHQRQMNAISDSDFQSKVQTELEKKKKVMQELSEKLK